MLVMEIKGIPYKIVEKEEGDAATGRNRAGCRRDLSKVGHSRKAAKGCAVLPRASGKRGTRYSGSRQRCGQTSGEP